MNSLTNSGLNKQSTSKIKLYSSSNKINLYVAYMVSLRCKMIVKSEVKKLGLKHSISINGALEFPDGISKAQQIKLRKNLKKSGLELLGPSESFLIDKIINTIIEVIHHSDNLPKISFKEIIHKDLVTGSESMLQVFSKVKGISVTQFIIEHKIERAKDLLLYYDLTLTEIAEKLNYKNKQFFVSQFKKVTGLPPLYFTELKEKRTKIISQK